MKKDEIHEGIHDYFKRIEKLFQRIIKDYREEDIHKFRTTVKKLRSFLHLLEMENEEGIHFGIVKKLKTVYGYAGIIRNIQIQIASIIKATGGGKVPANYIKKLNAEESAWKQKIGEYMDKDNNFEDEEELLLSKTPQKLRKKSIRQFIRFTLYKMHTLQNRMYEDDSVHSFRKILKDFYYNRLVLEPYSDLLPARLSDDKALKTDIELMGQFHDKCISLALLQTYNDHTIEDKEEKEILHIIEEKWEREKQVQKQKIEARLKLLHITPAKIKSISFVDSAYQ